MRELDTKKDTLENQSSKIAKLYFSKIAKQKGKGKKQSATKNLEEKKTLNEIKSNFEKIKKLSKEKIDIAKKLQGMIEK